jgi:hypothetical protein
MDLIAFHPDYRVVACRRYQCAIAPKSIARHLRALHREVESLTNLDIRRYAQCFGGGEEVPCDPPKTTQQLQPPRDAPPIPYLALHHDGYRCRFCPSTRPYVFSNIDALILHLRVAH